MRTKKLTTNKLKTSKFKTRKIALPGGGSVGPLPPGICPTLLPAIPTAGPLGISDATVVKTGQTFEITSTDVAGGQALYQTELLYQTAGEKAAYEITVSNISELDSAVTFAFGFGLFGGTFGYFMALADLVNGVLQDTLTQSDLINPWANPVTPLTFQLQLDGVAGTLALIGPDGSTVWTLSGGDYTTVLQNFALYYFFGAQTGAALGATIDIEVNAGRTPFVHPLPAGFKAFCELATQNASYIFFAFAPIDGTAGIDPADTTGRTIFIENGGSQAPRFTGSMGYPALTVPVPYDWNVYEHEIIQLDANTLDDYWRMGYIGFLTTQGGHVYESNSIYALETYYALGNLTRTECFNNIALSIGDVMALVVKNRRESEGPLLVRPYYNIAGEECLFDPIEVPPSGVGEDYVPNCQIKSVLNAPAGNTAKVRFNGEDGDYAGTYVDTFKDIQGAAITGSIPEVRETWFENRTFYTTGGTLPTITVSNTRLTVANVSGSDMTAKTHSRTLANMNDGQVIAAIQLNTLVAADEYEFYFEGVNTDAAASQFGIEFDGVDLVMTSNNAGAIEAPQVIQAAHTVTAGDQWGIQYDPDNSRARGILVRGASTFVSGWIDVDTLFSGTVYMPRASTGTVADTETCIIDCQYKVANMSAEMRTAAAGANDLEGNAA